MMLKKRSNTNSKRNMNTSLTFATIIHGITSAGSIPGLERDK